ncbi:MAG: hypothetical protein AAGF11_46380 [Myxococcota bacterium]
MIVVLVGPELTDVIAIARALSRALNATVVDGTTPLASQAPTTAADDDPEGEGPPPALCRALASPRTRPHVIVLGDPSFTAQDPALGEGPTVRVMVRPDDQALVVTSATGPGDALVVEGSGDAEAVATRLLSALLRCARADRPPGYAAPAPSG